ncbi:hypothetical protein [Haloarchaeobius sp. HME9146]|uniref:hypothetical protein n=1 Tax=Haloarchaeobius sp. HME9146 TaxID=2978732 RepID=UPI0021C14132|nr:hypothetical protein [Haloarchaeobius sp. HME9146]MCT9096602.1 hypothetical protein [Haloarchaeobius sp. HME9146]
MNRRRFLALAAATSVAGCNQGGPSTEGQPTDTPTSTGTGTAAQTATPGTTDAPADDTPEETTTGDEPVSRPLRLDRTNYGVALSPRSYSGDDFTEFFDRASETGTLVRSGGPWAELGNPESGGTAVARLAGEFDYTPVVEVNVFAGSSGELNRPLTEETIEENVELARAFAIEHRPAFLGLGVEVDTFYRENPDAFQRYVTLVKVAAQAVKDAVPETTVGVGFQLERLRGLRGGIFGGENDPDDANWELLDVFPSVDVFTFTTFPGMIYTDPADIPDDYYTSVFDRVDRPVGITETGWTAETVVQGWESSEAKQARYVERLFELTADVDLALAIWSFVYDQPGTPTAFETMSLRRADGSPRPAWDAWVDGVASAGNRVGTLEGTGSSTRHD